MNRTNSLFKNQLVSFWNSVKDECAYWLSEAINQIDSFAISAELNWWWCKIPYEFFTIPQKLDCPSFIFAQVYYKFVLSIYHFYSWNIWNMLLKRKIANKFPNIAKKTSHNKDANRDTSWCLLSKCRKIWYQVFQKQNCSWINFKENFNCCTIFLLF